MAFAWLLAVLVMMALDRFDVGSGHDNGGPSGEDRGTELPLRCLPGDSLEAIIARLDGSLRVAPHHDDWEGVQW